MKTTILLILLLPILNMQQPFPFEKLVVKDVYYEFTQEIEDEQDAELELRIDFEPFEIEGEEQKLSLAFIGFSNPELEKSVFSNGYRFSKNDELEPSSIYLQSVHNPIDLRFLKIEQKGNQEMIEMELFFDFEFERTDYKNELLKIKFQREK